MIQYQELLKDILERGARKLRKRRFMLDEAVGTAARCVFE